MEPRTLHLNVVFEDDNNNQIVRKAAALDNRNLTSFTRHAVLQYARAVLANEVQDFSRTNQEVMNEPY